MHAKCSWLSSAFCTLSQVVDQENIGKNCKQKLFITVFLNCKFFKIKLTLDFLKRQLADRLVSKR